MQTMQIKKNGLILIPATYEAVKRITKVSDVSSTMEFLEGLLVKIPKGWLTGIKETTHLFEDELHDNLNIGWSSWFIIERESNMLIGVAGFKGKPDREGLVEIDFQIYPSFRNKGYATTAVEGIIAWGFNHENVKKVRAKCRYDDFTSIRVLEKAGLRKVKMEGLMIDWELIKPLNKGVNPALIGYCGFYCGSCPTYKKNMCTGCILAHEEGDCYTNTCVKKKNIRYCGDCSNFPCEEIINNEKATILDPAWLYWKREEKDG